MSWGQLFINGNAHIFMGQTGTIKWKCSYFYGTNDIEAQIFIWDEGSIKVIINVEIISSCFQLKLNVEFRYNIISLRN